MQDGIKRLDRDGNQLNLNKEKKYHLSIDKVMEFFKAKQMKDRNLNQDLDSEYNKLQPINFQI